MRAFKFFCSFQGRLSRRSYWLRLLLALLTFVVGFAVISVLAFLLMGRLRGGQADLGPQGSHEVAGFVVPFLLADFVFYLWAVFAITARRCHDLGVRGREMFGFRVSNISIGFKRGTVGPNAFGPDPLAARDR
jgi:uncharacterized membrane protein YhaH (DUF805 family)